MRSATNLFDGNWDRHDEQQPEGTGRIDATSKPISGGFAVCERPFNAQIAITTKQRAALQVACPRLDLAARLNLNV